MQKCSLIFQVCTYANHYLPFFRELSHKNHGGLIKILLFGAIIPLIAKPIDPLTQVIAKKCLGENLCKKMWRNIFSDIFFF